MHSKKYAFKNAQNIIKRGAYNGDSGRDDRYAHQSAQTRICVPKRTIKKMHSKMHNMNKKIFCTQNRTADIMKFGYKKKRLKLSQYSSINGTKMLMMFTNTYKMIYAVAIECYKVMII